MRQARRCPPAWPDRRCSSVEHGVVRARSEVRAQHGVERERALEQRRLEDLLEHVVDVDAGDAQELAHVLAAEQADVEAERGRAHEVRAPAAAEPRRLAVVLLRQDARELQHARVVLGEPGAVVVGQRAGLELAVLETRCSPRGRERDGLEALRARQLEAVRGELELARDARIEQVQEVRAGRDAEARRELARDGGAADLGRGLEHEHFATGAREIGGAGEAVVAGADDDDAIPVSHRTSPPARCSGGRGPSGSRARRSRPARP